VKLQSSDQQAYVVTVKDGYARNFLLPRGAAIAWTLGGEKQIEGIRRARAAREIRDIDHAKEIKATLESAKVVVSVKTGTAGRLFGSVTDKDIAAAIKSVTKIDIDRHNIKTSGHIKKTGSYSVKVSLGHSVVATVSVSVVAA